ncbi:hypothetical protein IEN85_10535 [Pelagicoccus sp. NFK12]|uniref:Uncharacterized protein n=1 Tax=Pelagicoccus enzymogenes TaxID=2773457 RepID=A0A927IHX8_9BACT|nr:hypothetical protein [Pelagicoccus enzymogenes]MBD5779925.1 hypothetical protein [Pelagicoccus enzymogenes]
MNLLSAVVGGLIAGVFSILATVVTLNHQKKKRKTEEEDLIFGLLQAIYDEVDTLWSRFRDTSGSYIGNLEPGSAFLFLVPISQDYFIVYKNNAHLIGKIKDNDLRKAIVSTYTKGSGLIDSLRMNNLMVENVEHWHQMFLQTKDETHQSIMNTHIQQCAAYASKISESYNDLKTETEGLLRRLQQKGVTYLK